MVARGWLGKISKGWKNPASSPRAVDVRINAEVAGDANQDGNSNNDRIPGVRPTHFTGPNYASADMRIARRLFRQNGYKLELTAESFNLLIGLTADFRSPTTADEQCRPIRIRY
jgi:hypothetical protein